MTIPILVLAGTRREFEIFREEELHGSNSHRCIDMRYVSSHQTCRGIRNCELIILDGAKYNKLYDQYFYDILYQVLDETHKLMLKKWLCIYE